MAYIGSTPTSQNFISGTDYFSGTGSQTAFTLTRTVNSVNDIEVVINNVVQQPSTAYTLSGTTITFTSAPSSGTNNIYVRYLATTMQSITVPANSITRTQLDSNLQAGFQGRNRIINGAMTIDQRNAGASTTAVNNTYLVDRFYYAATQASKFTAQQNAGSVTPPTGFKNYLGFTTSSAYSVGSGDLFVAVQRIEGYNIADLEWGTANAKTVTLSFWVRSSLTGTFGGSLANDGGGTSYPYSYTINAANTWEYKTITIVGPTIGSWNSTNGMGIQIVWSLGVGSGYSGTAGTWAASTYLAPTGNTSVVGTSGATFYITGVQLEEGTTATSFERESYSVTLQKCQRYYTQWGKSATFAAVPMGCLTASVASCRLYFPVTMRTSPSCSLVGTINTDYQAYYNGGYKTLSNAGISDVTSDSLRLDAVTSSLFGGGGCALFYVQTTSGAITATAEL